MSGGSDDGDDVSGVGSHVLANEAAGSGCGYDQRLLHGGGGDAVNLSPAGVLAKEEGRLSNDGIGHVYLIFDEERRLQPRVEFVYSPFVVSSNPDSPRFKFVLNLIPPAAPHNSSSASGVSSSSQGGDQDQSTVVVAGCRGHCDEPVVDDRALNAPSNKGRGADDTKEELVSKRRHDHCVDKRVEQLGRSNQPRSQVPSSSSSSSVPVARRLSFTPSPVSFKCRPGGAPVEIRMIDGTWLSLEPVSRDWSGWYRPRVHRPVCSCVSSECAPSSSPGNKTCLLRSLALSTTCLSLNLSSRVASHLGLSSLGASTETSGAPL